MNKQRDTQGRPNLTERFLYHTAIGRWYDGLRGEYRHTIDFIAVAGAVSLFLAVYILIEIVS